MRLVRQWEELRGGCTEAAKLFGQLEDARAAARPPISNFRVGAVARGLSGRVYLGCNLEFRGLGLQTCIHAEEFALISALNHREPRVVQLALSTAPCGYCRQILAEAFFTLEAGEGGSVGAALELFIRPNETAMSLQDLLPMAFGPRDLGATVSLFSPHHHPLERVQPEPGATVASDAIWERLTEMALDFAARSHAPYSNSPAGVALAIGSCGDEVAPSPSLQMAGEEMLGGSYYENCAFNPSISPMKAAIVAVVCAEKALDRISHVVLVEVRRERGSETENPFERTYQQTFLCFLHNCMRVQANDSLYSSCLPAVYLPLPDPLLSHTIPPSLHQFHPRPLLRFLHMRACCVGGGLAGFAST